MNPALGYHMQMPLVFMQIGSVFIFIFFPFQFYYLSIYYSFMVINFNKSLVQFFNPVCLYFCFVIERYADVSFWKAFYYKLPHCVIISLNVQKNKCTETHVRSIRAHRWGLRAVRASSFTALVNSKLPRPECTASSIPASAELQPNHIH